VRPSRRIDNLPPYAFAELDRLRDERAAQGVDVIDFGVGDPIFIEGRLTYRQWEDKDGNKRNKLSVTAENFEFLGGRRGERGQGGGGGGGQAEHQEAGGELGNAMGAGIDEVPF